MTEFPSFSRLNSLKEIEELAQKFSLVSNWGMGAFIAVFNPPLDKVLLVKTGEYAKDSSGGMEASLREIKSKPLHPCRRLKDSAS